MNFSTLATIRRLLAPQHELSCSWWLWRRLLTGLRDRGQDRRESGAFLLGRRDGEGRARVVDFVLYDDLDPDSIATGIIRFDGRYFGKLWEICRRHSVTVVADVHTHPGGSGQSASDQENPMIARPGHLALIVPRFARPPVRRPTVGIYRYLGSHRWEIIPEDRRCAFFLIGL
jgi:hypothetical protein